MAQFFMRRQQMFGALGDRGFQGFIGRAGGAERGLQRLLGSSDLPQQDGREQQDRRGAGEVDSEQDEAGLTGISGADRQ